MLIGGIDEAGRGPVIGPMVIVGVEGEEKDLERLQVRDSKKYNKRGREKKFFEIIRVLRSVHVRVISPPEIDKYVEDGKLNLLEAEYFSSIISEMKARKIYVDAFTNPPELALSYLRIPEGAKVICEHRADSRYKVVSAASVIAKVLRDSFIDLLAQKLGEKIGSGYPSDPVTMNFLRRWIEEHQELPSWVRKSWKTVKELSKRSKTLF